MNIQWLWLNQYAIQLNKNVQVSQMVHYFYVVLLEYVINDLITVFDNYAGMLRYPSQPYCVSGRQGCGVYGTS